MVTPVFPLVPYLPPFDPFFMSRVAFDQAINHDGVRLLWRKSHLCPCTFAGQITGSPDPNCLTCFGHGWYWDDPVPFIGLMSFMHMAPSPDEPGVHSDPTFGLALRSEPLVTIPYSFAGNADAGQDLFGAGNLFDAADLFNLQTGGTILNPVWQQASLNDLFVEVDAIDRYDSQLQVSGVTTVPYSQELTIATSGAVRVYDTYSHRVVVVGSAVDDILHDPDILADPNILDPNSTWGSYTVSGRSVIVSGFPEGTPYIVTYTAAKTFVAFREAGGLAHPRPFAQDTLPKRFRLQQLDLWLRGTGNI